MQNIIDAEIKRVGAMLPNQNPLSGDYKILLEHLEDLYSLAWDARGWDKREDERPFAGFRVPEPDGSITYATSGYVAEVEPTEAEEEPEIETTAPVAEEKPKKAKAKKAKASDSEQQSMFPAEEEPKTYTSEEMRKKLNDAAARGINIKPIITKFIPDGKPIKFSEISKDKYGELNTYIEMEMANAE